MDPWAASITNLLCDLSQNLYQRPTRGCGQLASVCSEPLGTQEEVLPPFLTTVTLIPARGRAITSGCPIPTIAEVNFLPRGKRQMLSFFLCRAVTMKWQGCLSQLWQFVTNTYSCAWSSSVPSSCHCFWHPYPLPNRALSCRATLGFSVSLPQHQSPGPSNHCHVVN